MIIKAFVVLLWHPSIVVVAEYKTFKHQQHRELTMALAKEDLAKQAYEDSLKDNPNYTDGSPRPTWNDLISQYSWAIWQWHRIAIKNKTKLNQSDSE